MIILNDIGQESLVFFRTDFFLQCPDFASKTVQMSQAAFAESLPLPLVPLVVFHHIQGVPDRNFEKDVGFRMIAHHLMSHLYVELIRVV